ncbi:nuclease domain-containing protein [Paraburkholderia terrae]|uniref:nuclease domain-containing protein n=1 Tax=Paraburkholderia terrae TaxID=311230 RepID=UPI001EE2EECA|nr:DUF2357 domain-containing protein [Paraburkholderia terrae]GJH02773.1 DUF2357 domain-containing protein [Paraburkholderia terrae]
MDPRQHLVIHAMGLAREELGNIGPGGLISGLREDASYLLKVSGATRLYVDDVPLTEANDGYFTWTSGFFAGRVEVISADQKGVETSFYLEVVPANSKLQTAQFASMIDAIRRFDQRLLLGQASACLGFGNAGMSGKFDELVRWERVKRHGSAFLKCVESITRIPHVKLKPMRQLLPLMQIKRLPVAALRDRRIVALATGRLSEYERIDSIRLHTQVPVATVDTAANRAICALLNRFRRAIIGLESWAMSDRGELSDAEALGRCNRRLAILRSLDANVSRLLSRYPFRAVDKPEITAAGLTQIAANPIYSRAFRTGTEALRLGVEDHASAEHLHVSPSWGVYETWCYVALANALESRLGVRLKPRKSRFNDVSPELTLAARLLNGDELELMFQTTFRSDGISSTRKAWSLSRERRPDIVLVASRGSAHRMLILDAKYRSGRSNVLDAMASAHIYHDSLYLDDRRPDLSLLLLPGASEVDSLERRETWETFGVGVVSAYSEGLEGIERCVEAIATWL